NALANEGQGAVRTGPISRGWPQWTRSDAEILADSKRDVQQAKQLLSDAGYPNGLETEWIYNAGGANPRAIAMNRVAEIAQQQLKDAGIDMKINLTDATSVSKRLQSQDFSLSTWTIRAYPEPDDYLSPFFLANGSKNWGKAD